MGLIKRAIVVGGLSAAAAKYFGDPKKGQERKQQVSNMIERSGIMDKVSQFLNNKPASPQSSAGISDTKQ